MGCTAKSGKRIAFGAAILALAVAVAFGFFSRKAIREHWFIYQLKSQVESRRLQAADKLSCPALFDYRIP